MEPPIERGNQARVPCLVGGRPAPFARRIAQARALKGSTMLIFEIAGGVFIMLFLAAAMTGIG
jgi:hypothetical protein